MSKIHDYRIDYIMKNGSIRMGFIKATDAAAALTDFSETYNKLHGSRDDDDSIIYATCRDICIICTGENKCNKKENIKSLLNKLCDMQGDIIRLHYTYFPNNKEDIFRLAARRDDLVNEIVEMIGDE